MTRKEPTHIYIIFVLLIRMSATSTMQEHGHASGRLDNDDTNASPTGGTAAAIPRPSGRRRAPRRRSTDILARENLLALLAENSDSDGDNDTVDTTRIEEMAQEVQLRKQFKQSFDIHDAVAHALGDGEGDGGSGGAKSTRGGRRPSIDRDSIVSALTRNDLFLDHNVPPERIVVAAARFERVSYADGAVILRQGDDDFANMCWYLIARGRCQVLIDGRPLPRLGRYGGLGRGKTFGEVSLMREEARSATIVAEGEVVLYQLPREDFLSVIDTGTGILDGDDDEGNGGGGGPDDGAGTSQAQGDAPADTGINESSAPIVVGGDVGGSDHRKRSGEESLPHLQETTREEGGAGSAGGLLGSWYEQTAKRMAPLMQRETSTTMERRASLPPSFAQKLFSIVGAGLKEEIDANRRSSQ